MLANSLAYSQENDSKAVPDPAGIHSLMREGAKRWVNLLGIEEIQRENEARLNQLLDSVLKYEAKHLIIEVDGQNSRTAEFRPELVDKNEMSEAKIQNVWSTYCKILLEMHMKA